MATFCKMEYRFPINEHYLRATRIAYNAARHSIRLAEPFAVSARSSASTRTKLRNVAAFTGRTTAALNVAGGTCRWSTSKRLAKG
jgi:hypothetical protein